MLDIKFVRMNPDVVKENIKKKFQDDKLPLVDEVLELDQKNRDIKQEVEALRADRNKISKQIGACMACLLYTSINTVILGKPNAGKSSLLNVLVGEERAIVTDVAGTTRDVIQETINLQGISLNIMDTAGIRSTEDIVEKIGVDKAIHHAKEADLIIYVIDVYKRQVLVNAFRKPTI